MSVQYLRIQVRRDTLAAWESANPTLLIGEVGYETDTKRTKTGDGALDWKSLPYDKGGITSVDSTSGLALSDNGVLSNNFDHDTITGDLGGETVKVYVDAADVVLQAAIDAEEASRMAADQSNQDAIVVEAAARLAGDSALDSKIDITKSDLQANIDAEITARGAADDTLGNQIDAEEADRVAADATLQSNIDAEAVARAAQDVAAMGQIDQLKLDVTAAEDVSAALDTRVTATEAVALSAEAKADENADVLDSYVGQGTDAVKTAIDAVQADVDQNETDGDAADAALSGRLDTLEADPTTQTLLTAEATTRGTDDTALSGRLDTLEADPTTQNEVNLVNDQVQVLKGDESTAGSVANLLVAGLASGTAIAATSDSSYKVSLTVGDPASATGEDGQFLVNNGAAYIYFSGIWNQITS